MPCAGAEDAVEVVSAGDSAVDLDEPVVAELASSTSSPALIERDPPQVELRAPNAQAISEAPLDGQTFL